MKTVLALETSTKILSVALGTRDGRIREAHSRRPLQHSENLIPLIERLLKQEKLSLGEIDAFAINRGPGSFTGLRIGFSLLKGILAVRKRPCHGALSLDMMAAKVTQGSRLGVLIDARREKIYSRFYRFQKEKWMPEGKLEVLSMAALISRVSKGMALVGDPSAPYAKELKIKPALPSARTLVEWFQTENPGLVPLRVPRDFIPLYFRASEAEEKRKGS